MRKLLFLLSMTAFLAVSCSKDSETDTKQDLADLVVGIYSGTLTVTDSDDDEVQIRVTKLSATEIQIQPYGGDESSSFGARLTKDVDGAVLTIPEIKVDGGSIRGNINVLEGYPDAHGAYETATKAFAYAIKVSLEGEEYDEVFVGVKK